MSTKSSLLVLSLIIKILAGCSSAEFGDCPGIDGATSSENESCLNHFIRSRQPAPPPPDLSHSDECDSPQPSIQIPLKATFTQCRPSFNTVSTADFAIITISPVQARNELTLTNGLQDIYCQQQYAQGPRRGDSSCTVRITPDTSNVNTAAINDKIKCKRQAQQKLIINISQFQLSETTSPWKSQANEGAIQINDTASTIMLSKEINNILDINNASFEITNKLTCKSEFSINLFTKIPYMHFSNLRFE